LRQQGARECNALVQSVSALLPPCVCAQSVDLQRFEIRFEFESDDSESDGLIRNFQLSRRTTNHAYCYPKKLQNRCAVVIEIYFMFVIL